MKILLGYILTYGYIFLVLVITNLIGKKKNLKSTYTRKIIHILVGLSWFIMACFFNTSWHLIIPPLTFIVINYITYKKDYLKFMQRENSKGTIYYAISLTILSIITVLKPKFLPFYGIGALSMTIGDGLAPFIGEKFSKHKIGKTNKTIAGSLTVFFCTLLILICFNSYYILNLSILKILLLSIVAVSLEIVGKDLDNLSLPISLSCIAYLVWSNL